MGGCGRRRRRKRQPPALPRSVPTTADATIPKHLPPSSTAPSPPPLPLPSPPLKTPPPLYPFPPPTIPRPPQTPPPRSPLRRRRHPCRHRLDRPGLPSRRPRILFSASAAPTSPRAAQSTAHLLATACDSPTLPTAAIPAAACAPVPPPGGRRWRWPAGLAWTASWRSGHHRGGR
jgi:hypothetical protein